MTPAIPALLKKSRLDWWRTAALAVLWAETLVTVAWLPVTILAAGLGLALLGVLPGGLVFPLISLASLAAAAGLAATLAWRRLAPPDARAAERRLEHDSALPHRPFETLADAPAAGDQSLWQAHFDRAKSALTRLTLHAPRPGLPARDPLALRAMGALLLLAGLIAAGDQAGDRLARAFLPGLPSGGPAPLLQAWDPAARLHRPRPHPAPPRRATPAHPLQLPPHHQPHRRPLRPVDLGPGRPLRLRRGRRQLLAGHRPATPHRHPARQPPVRHPGALENHHHPQRKTGRPLHRHPRPRR